MGRALGAVVGLACALQALTGCAHRQRGPDGQPLWFRVETPHFEVVADTSLPDAQRMATQLERVLLALQTGSWSAANAPWRKARVIVLADQAEMRTYFRKDISGLAAADVLSAPLLVFNAEQDPSELNVLKHELAHLVDNQFLVRQPRWLAEGLACELETVTIEHDGKSALLGEINLGRLTSLRTMEAFDFAQVMKTGNEVYGRSEREVADFYAQAWLLVHLLVQHHRAALDQYFARLARSEDPDKALQDILGPAAFAGLGQEAVDYLKLLGNHGAYQRVRVPLPPQDLTIAVSTLTPSQVLSVQAETAEAARHLGGLPGLREISLQKATEAWHLDPGDVRARLLMLSLTEPAPDERIAALRALTVANPSAGHAWRLLADALRDKPGFADEEQHATLEAARLLPEDGRAIAGLAYLQLKQSHADEAAKLGLRAARLSMTDPSVLDTFALTLAQSGRCKEADDVEARALEARALEVLPERSPASTISELTARRAQFADACRRVNTVKALGIQPVTVAPGDPDAVRKAMERAQATANQANARPLTDAQNPMRIAERAQPKRTCKAYGPRVLQKKGQKNDWTVEVHFNIEKSGKIGHFLGDAKAPKELNDAIAQYLSTCSYAVTSQMVLPAQV
ncbi:MAG: DUF1570 domain-containing protein, partial [Deltaproteobacteria bacterium]|nr:DUF1570 domain-containing protein [Deltaproteobacteria bacterium]